MQFYYCHLHYYIQIQTRLHIHLWYKINYSFTYEYDYFLDICLGKLFWTVHVIMLVNVINAMFMHSTNMLHVK